MKHFALAAVVALIAAPALAADLASGDEISAAVTGNTITGGMSDGTAYAEFYDADGTIKADGYTGAWSIEGDAMCFDYGEGKGCWGVAIDGDMVTWMNEGASEGTGTITSGNSNEF